ncbi:hypothetical protein AR687_18290 [Flavobacteriaceae bacterium CRH]|nr:hypothetical protein AR687_18290 [Flavobacteriaceae bacterium CRH]
MIPTYNITDFPSDQSIGNHFMLENFEKLNRPKNLKWPHKHSFYEIQWLTQGSATNVIDYHQINIEPNTLFFISPGQLHLMSKTEDVKGYTITFTEEFLLMHASNKNALFELSFLDNSYSNPFLKLNTSTILEIEPLLQLLVNEVGRTKKSEAIIGHLLYALLNRIQRIVNAEQLKNQDVSSIVKFKQFKRLVEENFKTQNSLSFYSDKLFLSKHRINEICKNITGHAAGEVIRERLLLETKRLLLHSDMNIGEISEELGFKDFSYFSRQFKKSENITPAEYRKSMYEKYQNR